MDILPYLCVGNCICFDCWREGFSHPASLLSVSAAREVHQPAAAQYKGPRGQEEGQTAELGEEPRL